MRLTTFLVMVTAAVALPSPAPVKRGVNCPSSDKDNTALTGSSTTTDTEGNVFAVCAYKSAGTCTYFTDGSFSSGSSTCPKGLAQDTSSLSGGSSSVSTSSSTSSGSIQANINCPASDKDGTPLTSSSSTTDDLGNDFAVCTYQDAGPCTYFSDGSFSSGSSTCPKGESNPNLGGGGGGNAGTTTTTQQQQTTPPPATTSTTSTPPPPPPPTTSTTSTTSTPPPPPTSTTSTDTPPPVLSSSTAAASSTTDAVTAPPAQTSAPPVEPTSTTIDLTTVIVTPSADPNAGSVANPEGALNGAPAARPAIAMLAALPLVYILSALL